MTQEIIESSEIELPVPVIEAIASWRRVFAGRNGADPRDLLRKASADLWEVVEINGTVHPQAKDIARQEVVDVLQSLAESVGIGTDEAQAIFAESFSGGTSEASGKDDKSTSPPLPTRLRRSISRSFCSSQ